jgi:hypothetical protein
MKIFIFLILALINQPYALTNEKEPLKSPSAQKLDFVKDTKFEIGGMFGFRAGSIAEGGGPKCVKFSLNYPLIGLMGNIQNKRIMNPPVIFFITNSVKKSNVRLNAEDKIFYGVGTKFLLDYFPQGSLYLSIGLSNHHHGPDHFPGCFFLLSFEKEFENFLISTFGMANIRLKRKQFIGTEISTLDTGLHCSAYHLQFGIIAQIKATKFIFGRKETVTQTDSVAPFNKISRLV